MSKEAIQQATPTLNPHHTNTQKSINKLTKMGLKHPTLTNYYPKKCNLMQFKTTKPLKEYVIDIKMKKRKQ